MMVRCLDALDSTASNGVVRIKVGDAASNEGLSADCGVWGTDGFVSRPDLPSDAGACEVLTITDGHERRVVGSRDKRQADKVGTLDPGDRAIIGSSPARVLLKKGTSAVIQYTEASDGSSMMTVLSGEDGTFKVFVGGSFITVSDDTIVLSAGGSSLEIGPKGVSVIGAHIGLNAMGINLGIIGAQGESPPAAPICCVMAGPSPLAAVPCLHVTVSPV